MKGFRDMTYPAISQFQVGSYQWAMDQVRAGNDMRRVPWPIEVTKAGSEVGAGDGASRIVKEDEVAIWHVYLMNERVGSMCKGFSSGVVGADNDMVGDLGVDSSGYTPSNQDLIAMDWQFVTDVTQKQIEYYDAHRYPHITPDIHGNYAPLPPVPTDNPIDPHKWVKIAAAIAVPVVLALLFWLFSK
jgi:hypothetical protein